MRHTHHDIDYSYAQRQAFHQAFWHMLLAALQPSKYKEIATCH